MTIADALSPTVVEAASKCTVEVVTTLAGSDATSLIIITGVIGILFALFLMKKVSSVSLDVSSVNVNANPAEAKEQNIKMVELYDAIGLGASIHRNVS